MWIKEPPKIFRESSNNILNFLYRKDKIFIMDNHRGAPWAWLQLCNTDSTYNFFHIDKHYDLLDHPIRVKNEVIDKGIDVSQLELTEYLDLQEILNGGLEAKVFSYDNYIANLLILYPSLFNEKVFATHKDGNINETYINREIDFYHLIDELEGCININTGNKWIINIDIDYFYLDKESNYFQAFTFEFIWNLFEIIRNGLENIQVVTIALSPECCGSWDNAYRIARNISAYLKLDFQLDI